MTRGRAPRWRNTHPDACERIGNPPVASGSQAPFARARTRCDTMRCDALRCNPAKRAPAESRRLLAVLSTRGERAHRTIQRLDALGSIARRSLALRLGADSAKTTRRVSDAHDVTHPSTQAEIELVLGPGSTSPPAPLPRGEGSQSPVSPSPCGRGGKVAPTRRRT